MTKHPYDVSKPVIAHIDAIVAAAHIPKKKRADLKRELTAYAEDYSRELHFTEAEDTNIDELIMNALGDAKQRGKEFTTAHRKLSRIPWIGPLFYDDAVMTGVMVLMMQFFGAVVWVVVLMFLGSVVGFLTENNNPFWILAVVNGLWMVVIAVFVRRRMGSLRRAIDAVSVAAAPVILYVLVSAYNFYVGPYTPPALSPVGILSCMFIYIVIAYVTVCIPWETMGQQRAEKKSTI